MNFNDFNYNKWDVLAYSSCAKSVWSTAQYFQTYPKYSQALLPYKHNVKPANW